MKAQLREKIKAVKVLILDVDGVLTNGEIVLDQNGDEIKIFNVHDGFGIVFFQKAGFKTAIISARSAPAVTVRLNDLGVGKIFQDARPKTDAYKQILKEYNITGKEVCFMADDLPDICVFKEVGFAVAVVNAAQEVKDRADYITEKEGGQGAVREVVELILKEQGKWEKVLEKYT